MARALPVTGLDPRGDIAVNVRRILGTRVAEVYGWSPAIDDSSAAEALHALRISIKRLRYILQTFDDVFGEAGQVAVERVKRLQQELGNLHDIDVRIALIEREIQAVMAEQTRSLSATLAQTPERQHAAMVSSAMRPPPDDPRRGLTALLARQHATRQAAYASFLMTWRRLHDAGLREDLVVLSTPLTKLPESVGPIIRAHLTAERAEGERT